MKERLTIGYNSKSYSDKRIIINKLANANYKDMRFYNYYVWINIVWWILKILKISPLKGHIQYIRLNLKYKTIFFTHLKIDALHLFNTINFSKKLPWVLTIETFVPYGLEMLKILESKNPDFSNINENKDIQKTMEALASDNCKGILPYSTCSYHIQLAIVNQFPTYSKAILDKMEVLHPPQELLIQNIEEKKLSYNPSEKLSFIFIGRQFYLKGGLQTLKAFDKFKNEHDFEVTIIADLDYEQSDFQFATTEEVEETKRYITQNKSWINHFTSLPNSEVLERIKNAHIGLFPTWIDTYGFVSLELQAGGCPVISTSVRSLSETNNNSLGWIIEVPTNTLNHPQFYTKDDFNTYAKAIELGMEKILLDIFTNRHVIREKAEACLKKIQEQHNPKIYANKLEQIYTRNSTQK